MPKITIDNQELNYEGKKTILQVALENGVRIPYYCYHPGLSIVASCRICLAEVAQPNPRAGNKLELIPRLVPTCQTPASDGMVVHTQSPKAIANQKAVMEYLLINHPLDCPVCDKAGECLLQDYSYQYGRSVSRFQEDKIKQPVKDLGPTIKLYMDRCIMCSRCVRFTREVTGTSEIGVFGRGSAEQIDVFPGKPLNNELSGNVADICPVGALADKDFLFTQRVWFLEQTPSIDGITASGDNINVEHNEGRIYRVRPRTNPDVNKWWISDEIRYGWKYVQGADRLVQPRRQQYGAQVECDWTRALVDVRDLFTGVVSGKATGTPGNLALLASPMLSCEEAYLLGRLVRGLDAKALLGVGLIPVKGEDKTFPGGYTIYAEKCPNSRGVRRALELLGGSVLKFEDLAASLTDKKNTVGGVLVTGNYPSPWITKELTTALSKKAIVWADILPNDSTARADVLLPTAAWVETAGAFENARGRLQSFAMAVNPPEGARPIGQIALDLSATCSLTPRRSFNAAAVRQGMGGAFVSDVHHPAVGCERQADLRYVEF